MPGLGARIRDARLEAAKRDRELEWPTKAARRLGEGSQTYGRYETDQREPPVSMLLRIAALYGVDAGELTFGPPEERAALLEQIEVKRREIAEACAAASQVAKASGASSRARPPG
jgi:transcriptional regulator with XRE-family HTH domain